MKRTRNLSNNKMLYFGIDNGVTGTIGAIIGNKVSCICTPTKLEQNYTKKKGNISRILYNKLFKFFNTTIENSNCDRIIALIERPMVNPGRFGATLSAIRALECTLIILENLDIPYQYIDSKEWQRELLPIGSHKEQLKKDSKDIGIRLFPQFKNEITKHKDADGLLIAEYARRYF